MKRRSLLMLGAAAPLTTGCAQAQRRRWGGASESELPVPRSEAEKRILGVLTAAMRAGELYLEVPFSDGRMLRLLAETTGATRVVEVGTSTGCSGLWLLMALQATGGKLTTFEVDRGRAAAARKHFAQAGVDGLVTVVEGDAHENVKQVKGPVDLVFLDADKEGYTDYLNRLLPLVRSGGLILAHNFEQSGAYGQAVTTSPDLETLVPGGSLAVTLKKR